MTKFKVGDIVAWPLWETYYRDTYYRHRQHMLKSVSRVYPVLFKIVSIEQHGNILQYNIEQWYYTAKCWRVSEESFFYSNSPMENGMVVMNKLYLLMKYEIG